MTESGIRRTKIVATLGPAWASPDQMHALFDAGVNVVRVNASHGTPDIRREWIAMVQRVREERRQAIGLLVDLQGPQSGSGSWQSPSGWCRERVWSLPRKRW